MLSEVALLSGGKSRPRGGAGGAVGAISELALSAPGELVGADWPCSSVGYAEPGGLAEPPATLSALALSAAELALSARTG